MKKIISAILVIVLVFSLAFVVSAEETSFNIDIKASSSSVKPGDEFTVDLLLTNITESSGIVGIDMKLLYDASKVIAISKTVTFPTQWGNDTEDMSSAYVTDASGNQTGVWDLRFAYDGESVESSIAVFKDNELGVKIKFKALENASGTVEIGLEGGKELIAVANSLKDLYGSSTPITITISSSTPASTAAPATTTTEAAVTTTAAPTVTEKETETTAAATSAAEVTETEPEASDTDGTYVSETTGSEETQAPISDVTETAGETETETTEETAAETEAETVSDADTSDTLPATGQKDDDGGNGTMTVIVIIVALAVVAAALFAILKFRNKTNDDNPVNPG